MLAFSLITVIIKSSKTVILQQLFLSLCQGIDWFWRSFKKKCSAIFFSIYQYEISLSTWLCDPQINKKPIFFLLPAYLFKICSLQTFLRTYVTRREERESEFEGKKYPFHTCLFIFSLSPSLFFVSSRREEYQDWNFIIVCLSCLKWSECLRWAGSCNNNMCVM